MKRHSLEGRVIVILGGAKGIGAATARLASAAGAYVLVGDRSLPEPGTFPDSRPRVRQADVTRESDLVALRDEVIRAHGHVDAVINCAAIIAPGPIVSLSWEAIRQQFEVNALGTALVSTVFLPHFRARGQGHLILVSSLGGIVPLPDSAAYSATKFAVRGWALALAEEVKSDGVDVSVVCPDSVETMQLLTEARGNGAPLSFTSTPLSPERVARAILGAVKRPRREICVPGQRGWVSKLAGSSTLVFRLAYPVLRAAGIRARAKYVARHSISTAPSAPGAMEVFL